MRRVAARLGIGAFDYQLAVCAIFKNEAPFLGDWLLFHAGVGVDHFYLYNNDSDDDYMAVLRPWIDKGMVTLKNWPGKGVQRSAYDDCLRTARYQSRWIAFIDLDEYLFSPSGDPLPRVLESYESFQAIFVYWNVFGSSGNVTRPNRPVVEACTMRFDYLNVAGRPERGDTTGRPDQGKSIVNPRATRAMRPHQPLRLKGQIVDEKGRPSPHGSASFERHSTEVLRINHYWARSIQDLYDKAARDSAADGSARNLEAMLAWDRQINSVRDLTIIPIWRRIPREMPSSHTQEI
jgi:hypothetical protein